jgi:ElaB/YqjD/DUF883 family membrane-anchored ribosome-binding protein
MTAAANGKHASDAGEATLRSQLEKAEADVALLAKLAGERGVEAARDLGDRAGETYEALSDEAAALVRQASERARVGAQALDKEARANPWLFIGGAVAIGCMIGATLRK